MKLRFRGLCLLFVFSLLFLTGCPSSQTAENPAENASVAPLNQTKDRSAGAFADLDPWYLKTSDPEAARGNHGVYMGNGYMGATFAPSEGDPYTAQLRIAGIYEGANETLATIPLPLVKGSPNRGIYPYEVNMKYGTLGLNEYDKTAKGDDRFSDYTARTVFISAVRPHIIAINNHTPQPPGEDAAFFKRKLNRYDEVKVYRTKTGRGDVVVVASVQGPLICAVYTSKDTPDPEAAARKAVIEADNAGFDALETEHVKVWRKQWADADIRIEGDPEAQQLIHKLMFDLLQSARAGGDDSIAPEALSGDFYKGHIFWDAEIWMFPALLAQHPDLARTILDYRFKHLPQAQEQAKKQGCKGADFPWESAATGKEVAPGGFSKGRHVTAGVGWAVWQYWLATNDKTWMTERGWPLLSNVADYFATRAKKNPATSEYEIKDVFGPDENKGQCDNNAYTNAMAKNVLIYATEAAKIVGKPANPQWQIVADKLKLPFDKAKGYYLARDDDKGEKTKQADGELLLWPAKLPMDARTAAATFDFHKARPITNGPAMTDSIHALIAARLGRADEAEKDFRDSYKPFVRGPFLLFSEKRSLDRCVFTTGAGGILQSVICGFGGLDFSEPGGIINAKTPIALPPTWKKLTITGIQWKGKRYTLTVTPEGRTLTPSG